MLLYLRIVIKCSVAQQSNVYVGVWSRYLRPCVYWFLGIDVCSYMWVLVLFGTHFRYLKVCARERIRSNYTGFRAFIIHPNYTLLHPFLPLELVSVWTETI